MVRFYGTGIYHYPADVLAILRKALPALRAEESIRLADATRAGWSMREDYLEWLDGKQKLSQPAREPEIATISPENEAWFKANGIPYKILETNEKLTE